jgi:hypothetical protein
MTAGDLAEALPAAIEEIRQPGKASQHIRGGGSSASS